MVHSIHTGIWKAYPTAGLAYTYFFGFLFMLMSIMYYVFTGQLELFLLPRQVREARGV